MRKSHALFTMPIHIVAFKTWMYELMILNREENHNSRIDKSSTIVSIIGQYKHLHMHDKQDVYTEFSIEKSRIA